MDVLMILGGVALAWVPLQPPGYADSIGKRLAGDSLGDTRSVVKEKVWLFYRYCSTWNMSAPLLPHFQYGLFVINTL